MAKPEVHRPGEKAPESGIYRPTDGGTKVAISKDDRFPPTTPGKGYVLDTPTKPHK
ncbi:MAG: YjzC family protein [Chloroflexi bacterium]|nr:YjzC family protein [Chloroflexota bacterium]